MDSDRLNRWLTLGANLGVLAGIFFLAAEIQQSNRIAIASNEFVARNSFNQFNDVVATETGVAEILVKASSEESELSDAETIKLYHIVVRGLNQWLAVEEAFENGVVPAETHNVIYDDMRAMLDTYPKVRTLLRQAIDNYPAMASSRVFTHLNELLAEYEL